MTPAADLPPAYSAFLAAPRSCVMATVRPDGAPASVPCWYGWDGARITLSLHSHAARLRNVRRDPRVSLTVLGDSWYQYLALAGTVLDLWPDDDLADLDALSVRYDGAPHANRLLRMVTATVRVDRWHAFGFPGPA